MNTRYSTTIAGFEIKLEQTARGAFRVTYGMQVRTGLTYTQASKELGKSIMHALACDGKLDNEVA